MKKVPFKPSADLTVGVELEYQIIDPETYDLISRAKDLIRRIKNNPFHASIKPEITQGMIEINSSVHQSVREMHDELFNMHAYLSQQGKNLGVRFAGGGTHPFRKWSLNKIFPTKRFKKLSRHYRHLSKQSTVFGQHVHIGCSRADDALYLVHAFTRYVPQLIAISASSPFYQGIDTQYHSSRSTIFIGFPTSGVIPYLTTWEAFSDYFYKMRHLGIIQSMKDFYWDIRPKPEFGTVEIRVCDTPLTLKKSMMIAAYVQAVAAYLLHERPITINHDLYHVYGYNRFEASRYGPDGTFIHPNTLKNTLIRDDFLESLKHIEKYANDFGNMGYMLQLVDDMNNKQNDATLLREIYHTAGSLPNVVREQCILWEK